MSPSKPDPIIETIDEQENGPRTIRVIQGSLPVATDQAELALLKTTPPTLFQRGGQLVHVERAKVRLTDGREDLQETIGGVALPALREYLSRAAYFETFDGRAQDWRVVDPPMRLVEAYDARPHWRLPVLRQLIGTPTLRHDGSLLHQAGYDPATGLFLVRNLDGLQVPERPSDQDARSAGDTLTELLREFPYEDGNNPGIGLSVALSGLLGAILRPSLPAAPLIAVTAPQAGTGKSYLVDVISTIATGERAAVAATGRGQDEFEKSLAANLLNGRPLLSLDNQVDPLGGQLLCMAITQSAVDIRPLGVSKTFRIPTSTAFFATGNNLKLRDDMSRRVLICRLDAHLERPEERAFDHDLIIEAQRRRSELVSAALVIARWHAIRRDPTPLGGRLFAGFADWCARVRDPILALGHVDPVIALDVARAADGAADELRSVLKAWAEAAGRRPTTVGSVVAMANERDHDGRPVRPALLEALTAVAAGPGAALDQRRLGKYLAKNEGRIIDGRSFHRAGQSHSAVLWEVDDASGS